MTAKLMAETPRITSPCRYCGERTWLSFHPQYDCESYVHDADGSLRRDADGTFAIVCVDYIACDMCDATAPAHVWNGAPVTPAMRAALVEVYEAYGAKPEPVRDLDQASQVAA